MGNSTGRVKRMRFSRGETLVETIVSFAVLAILLTMVTTVIKSGVAMNNRASANLETLYIDCVKVETDDGLVWQADDTLALACTGGSATTPGSLADHDVSVQVDVYRADILTVFRPEIVVVGG